MLFLIVLAAFASSMVSGENECRDGEFYGVLGDKSDKLYTVCENGKMVQKSCQDNEWVDFLHKRCKVIGEDLCEEGSMTYNDLNLTNEYYFLCVQGRWELRSCNWFERFDKNRQKCVGIYGKSHHRLQYCGPPKNCPVGQYYPDPCDCTKFYHCDMGGAVLKSCGPGTAWNALYQICDHIYKVQSCKKN